VTKTVGLGNEKTPTSARTMHWQGLSPGVPTGDVEERSNGEPLPLAKVLDRPSTVNVRCYDSSRSQR
jgi:hypothetical protein